MKFKYEITGIDCPNCAARLEGLIGKNEKITSAKINFLAERLTVESEADEAEVTAIVSAAAHDFSDKIVIEKK